MHDNFEMLTLRRLFEQRLSLIYTQTDTLHLSLECRTPLLIRVGELCFKVVHLCSQCVVLIRQCRVVHISPGKAQLTR